MKDEKKHLSYLTKQRAVLLRIVRKQNKIIMRFVRAMPDNIHAAKALMQTMDIETDLDAVMALTDTKPIRRIKTR